MISSITFLSFFVSDTYAWTRKSASKVKLGNTHARFFLSPTFPSSHCPGKKSWNRFSNSRQSRRKRRETAGFLTPRKVSLLLKTPPGTHATNVLSSKSRCCSISLSRPAEATGGRARRRSKGRLLMKKIGFFPLTFPFGKPLQRRKRREREREKEVASCGGRFSAASVARTQRALCEWDHRRAQTQKNDTFGPLLRRLSRLRNVDVSREQRGREKRRPFYFFFVFQEKPRQRETKNALGFVRERNARTRL